MVMVFIAYTLNIVKVNIDFEVQNKVNQEEGGKKGTGKRGTGEIIYSFLPKRPERQAKSCLRTFRYFSFLPRSEKTPL
jgi:hypothetical protein